MLYDRDVNVIQGAKLSMLQSLMTEDSKQYQWHEILMTLYTLPVVIQVVFTYFSVRFRCFIRSLFIVAVILHFYRDSFDSNYCSGDWWAATSMSAIIISLAPSRSAFSLPSTTSSRTSAILHSAYSFWYSFQSGAILKNWNIFPKDYGLDFRKSRIARKILAGGDRIGTQEQMVTGVAENNGLLRAMGFAMIAESIGSALYHICPNSAAFQFG